MNTSTAQFVQTRKGLSFALVFHWMQVVSEVKPHKVPFNMHFLCISSWMGVVHTQQYFAGVGFLVMLIFVLFPSKLSGWRDFIAFM